MCVTAYSSTLALLRNLFPQPHHHRGAQEDGTAACSAGKATSPLEKTGVCPVSCSRTLAARVSLSPLSPTQMLRHSLRMRSSRMGFSFSPWSCCGETPGGMSTDRRGTAHGSAARRRCTGRAATGAARQSPAPQSQPGTAQVAACHDSRSLGRPAVSPTPVPPYSRPSTSPSPSRMGRRPAEPRRRADGSG